MDENLKTYLRERISVLPERSVATAAELLGRMVSEWDEGNIEEANGPDSQVRRLSRTNTVPLLDMYEIVRSKAGIIDVSAFPEPILNVLASGMFGWRSDGERFVALTLGEPPFAPSAEIIISKSAEPDLWTIGARGTPDGIDEDRFLEASGLEKRRFGTYVEKSAEEIPKTVLRIAGALGGAGLIGKTEES